MANVSKERSRAAAELGKHRNKGKERRSAEKTRTTQSYLRAVIAAIGPEDVSAISTAILERARAGEKDACEWVGKYLMGGGRYTPDDALYPPSVRRTR